MATFSVNQHLEQERPKFELADGEEIEFKLRVDLGGADIARMSKLSQSIAQLSNRLRKNPDDGRLADQYHALYGDFVMILLPDLPADNLEMLPTGARIEVINFWTQEQKATDGRNPLDFLP